MPTILRVGPYRFFFYVGNHDEPRHVHIERDDNVAKVWLDPVRLQRNIGFSAVELNRIRRLVQEHRDQLVEAWDGYFDRDDGDPER